MEYLGEEVDSALTTQKIHGDAFSSTSIPTTATLRVDTKTGSRSRKSRSAPDPFCAFCESRGHWAQDCKIVSDTARVWVTGPTGLIKLTRCVLDGGSQSSFITKSIVDELKLVLECRDLAIGAPESSPTPLRPRRLVRFSMKSISTNSTARITGFESTHDFSQQPAIPHDVKMLAHTRKLQLADPKDHTENMTLPIEIIIGVVLIPSKFVWILSGNRSGITVGSKIVNYIHSEQVPSYPDDILRKFWDLETLRIRENQDRQRTFKDSVILKAFEDSYFIEDKRRVVSLPRKEGVIPPTNRCNAERQFYNLEKRLQGNAHQK
ncbi:hypothetical protein ANN_26780 [Periplaneta americana]|uniref:CCHC-type domain-containing protein n=1 Tax=Periplaneta americana TaxID=6978 RepID=A0ABQ8RZN9_PERAM|nr:hypothetical protein ANN_26780 [Periplaneta americana]